MYYKSSGQKTIAKEPWKREFEDEENRLVKLSIVGKGTYGSVFKAFKMKDPSRFYAVKKVDLSMEKEGFPITALREIMLLRQLSHENIIRFLEIRSSKRLTNQQASGTTSSDRPLSLWTTSSMISQRSLCAITSSSSRKWNTLCINSSPASLTSTQRTSSTVTSNVI